MAQGFTLFELVVVMTIMAVVTSFAISSWQVLQSKVKVMVITHDLLTVLESTRNAALSGHHALKVCSFRGGHESLCELPWQGHLVAFADRNGNGRADADEAVMLNMPFMPDGFYLNWRSFRGEAFLEWNAKGYTATTNGTFTLCNSRKDEMLLRQFVVNRTGRVRLIYSARRGALALQSAKRACGW